MKLTPERWTVLRVLDWTQKYLQNKGIPSARLESELLLSHILGFDRVGLYLKYDMFLSPSELSHLRGLIQRRITGEPLQYITGYQEFWSIPFKVGPQVLIPRPETEVLVEEALRVIDKEDWGQPRIAEVGTGCGAIAISIAKSVPSARVMATEMSWDALVLAKENAIAQDVVSRIHFIQGNLLSFVKSGKEGPFDLVISNPPYIRSRDIDDLQREIRDFEPREAIDGGIDGLDFYRRLFRGAPVCLRGGGWVILEIGADQAEEVIRLCERIGHLKQPRIIPDYSRRSRALVVQKVRE